LRIEHPCGRLVVATLAGRVSLAHAQLLSQFTEACIDVAPVNLSLFHDLSLVTSLDFAATAHLATWARERALCFDRLHFLVPDPKLVSLVRSMFMALPVRAYLHKDRTSFEAARARLV
jgi:hypothetical protein